MPQDELPKLNKEQQALWDKMLRVVEELREISKLYPETFLISLEAIHPLAIRVPQKYNRTKLLLRRLGTLLQEAQQDDALSKYSFVQRHQNLIEKLLAV